MKTKQWLILLTSCVALAAAPLTGCGDDGDPSSNNGGSNNGNNGVADAGDDTGEEDAGGETDSGGGEDGGGEEDAGTDTDTGTELGTCTVNEFFTGQAYAEGEDAHNGGIPVNLDEGTVSLESTGLQAVWDAVPVDNAPIDENTDDDVDDSIVTLDTTLDVTGALVIATGRTDNPDTTDVIEGNDWLYLQDADTSIVLNGGFVGSAYPAGEEPATAIKVGDKVSFTVTGVRNYSGTPQIARVTGFGVDSSDNEVPFTDMTGDDVTMDSWGELIRVSGQLTADNGGCGGSATCYDLTHGDQTITFRSNSQFSEVGTCVTFFGPLGAFPGPLADSPTAQIDEVNWGWTFTADPS